MNSIRKVFIAKNPCIDSRGDDMRSRATARLVALNDATCEFLLAFFIKNKESNVAKIKKNIHIDDALLNSKIALLKESGLISNHKVLDDDDNVVDRLFSLTSDGEEALGELGYEVYASS